MSHIRPVTARLAPLDKYPVNTLQHTKMFQSPYCTVVTVIHTSLCAVICVVYTYTCSQYTDAGWTKKRRRRRRRTAVNAANKEELAACPTFVSLGVEARLRVGLPSHVSIPRFGQFYTPKRSGRL